ncbi:MAG: DNA polymerase III subunit beta [Armatimonadetes bacterium]|nr:DNA polymerase III subunit beta [Armatimonadota bacterium]
MKIVTQRDELAQAITVVGRAVSSRSTLPILSNILLEADQDGLLLGATDLEIGMRVRLAVEVESPGRTTLSARLLSEMIGAQSAGHPITLESDEEDHVTFRCGRSVVEVNGLPADEFPVIPSIDRGRTIVMPQAALRRMIQQCAIAVSGDETRARLTGMQVMTEGDRLRLVATDTHRLATRSHPLGAGAGEEVSEIVPGRAMRELERLLGDSDEATVQLDFTDTQAQFRVGSVTVITRLIEGEFVSYRKVIPATHNWTLTVEAAALRESVRRCAIVSREDNRKMIVRAFPSGPLQLFARSSKIGHADEELDTTSVVVAEATTEALEMAFNAEYLLQALMQISADEVSLELTAANQPGALRPVAEEDYIYVLMPMQMG